MEAKVVGGLEHPLAPPLLKTMGKVHFICRIILLECWIIKVQIEK